MYLRRLITLVVATTVAASPLSGGKKTKTDLTPGSPRALYAEVAINDLTSNAYSSNWQRFITRYEEWKHFLKIEIDSRIASGLSKQEMQAIGKELASLIVIGEKLIQNHDSFTFDPRAALTFPIALQERELRTRVGKIEQAIALMKMQKRFQAVEEESKDTDNTEELFELEEN